MKIIDIVHEASRWAQLPTVSPEPFSNNEALHEANMVGVLYIPQSPTVGLLFDLRSSMYFDARNLNTGIIIVRGVSQVSATCRGERTWKAWLVGDSSIMLRDSSIGIQFRELLWGESITVEGSSAEFIVGFVKGLGLVSADMHEDWRAYIETTQSWESQIELKAGLRLNRNGSRRAT